MMAFSGDLPCTAAELREFVDQMIKKHGIAIEYGCESLNRNDWSVDLLVMPALRSKLRKLVVDEKRDLLQSVVSIIDEEGFPNVALTEKEIWLRTRRLRSNLAKHVHGN